MSAQPERWLAGDRRLLAWLLLALGLLVAVWVYQPGLVPLLVLDDYASIAPLLRPDAPPWQEVLISPTGPLGRPISMLSFLLDRAWQGPDLARWKASNLALHGGIAVLIFGVSGRIFRVTGHRLAHTGAALVAVLWVLHPLHVSTVLYTVQRMTQLSMLCCLAGMGCYLRGRLSAPTHRWRRVWIYSAFGIWTPLAIFSKENGALLPLYLILLEATVLVGQSEPERQRLSVLFGIYLLGMTLAAVWVVAGLLNGGELAVLQRRGFSSLDHLLTEARVLFAYLAEVIAPSRAQFGFFHDDFPVSDGLWSPPTTAWAIVGHGLLLAAAGALRRRLPGLALGVLFFYAGHLLESGIVPLELMFEHRNALPSFGVLLAAVSLLGQEIHAGRVRLWWAAALVWLGLATLTTVSLVHDWSSAARFYSAGFALHPSSPVARAELAELLTVNARHAEADALLQGTDDPIAPLQRAVLACRTPGAPAPPVPDVQPLTNLPHLSVYAVTALTELATQVLDRGCAIDPRALAAALSTLAEGARVWPPFRYRLFIYAAHLRWRAGESGVAFALLARARSAAPDAVLVPLLATEWSLEIGDLAGARRYLETARASAYTSLSATERQMRDALEEALTRAQP